MPVHPLRAALALAGLLAAPALAQVPAPPPTVTTVYPGHWGGPFGLWYGGWQPEMVVQVPAPPPAQWQGPAAGSYDREGWLRECRRRLGDKDAGGAPGGQDRCEAMLAAPPAGYGYAVPVMLVPVTLVPAGTPPAATLSPPCTKTVVTTEEFVEAAPRRARHIAPRRAPDKRLRMVPDKRVPR